MSTLSNTDLTLLDVAKRTDPDGSTADIAEIIAQTNEVIEDIPFMEANGSTFHRSSIRSGLPAGSFRKANQGVANEKSTTVQVDDVLASLETYSEVDEAIAEMGGNLQGNLMSESSAFIQGLGETMTSTIFYGDNDVAPEKFHGLMPRFSSTSAENGRNVILGGGAGADNSSIYLVGWAPERVFMTYPQGSQAGLKQNFKGKQTLEDANGLQYEGYRTHYSWKAGMVVKDWRYVVRIANIDNSALTADKSGSSADLTDLIAQALEQIQGLGGVMPRFYMNRTLSSFLRRQRNNTTNVNIDTDEVFGRQVLTIEGVPVKRVDALTSTEATIS